MNLFKSLKFQILLVALIPIIIIDAFLTIRQVNSNIEQAEQLLQSKGEIIARQIAGASEFNLYTGNYRQIQHLLAQAIDTNEIIYSAVFDDTGTAVAEVVSDRFEEAESMDYFYYRHAVQTEAVDTEDVFSTTESEAETSARTLGWVHLYISRQRLQQNKIEIIKNGGIYFILSLVIATVLTMLISQRITRPIFALLDYLKEIETGNLGQVIKPIERNEIGEVQKGFNSMSQSLLANRMQLDHKIKSATLDLMNAITDLEYKNRELSVARDEAQKANQIKSQFLANISHEIRTPINGIQGFANLLLRTGMNPNQQRYAQIIAQSTADLRNIVNEVLDFSKLESDKVELVNTEFDLHELVESTRDSLFTAAMEKNIDLFLTIYSDTPRMVKGDKLRVKQVLVNLISNAIKFTDQGFVDITVHVEEFYDDEVVIRFKVKDSGIGISEQDQKLLFQAFKQIESDANRRFAGTGLGLVISKNLARLMRGDIQIDSRSGHGSLFTLVLPFATVTAAEEIDNDGQPLTGLLLAFDAHALNEVQSLFDRAGFDSEGLVLERDIDTEALKPHIQQNLNYLDFIVMDLRNASQTPDQLFTAELSQHKRIIVMHYDAERVDIDHTRYEFISVINTSRDVQRMMLRQDRISQVPVDVGEPTKENAREILIVDDNRINLMLACELTRMWGHLPFAAEDASKALQLFKQHDFDLILLDIQMPEIDGVELMQMMRAQRPQMQTPIVAITANVIESEQQRLLSLGFDAYLGKPLDEVKLKSLLNEGKLPQIAAGPETTAITDELNRAIDYDLTLKLSAQNERLSEEIFGMLRDEIPPYQEQLQMARDAEDVDALRQIVHKLQGVTCYAGLPALKHVLEQYDQIKHSDPQQIPRISLAISTELDRIYNELPVFLNQA